MASGPNLITGDSSTFEGGTVGSWTAQPNTTISNFNGGGHTGTHALATVSVAAGSYGAQLAFIPVSGSLTYQFNTWFYQVQTLRTVQFSILTFDGNNTLLSTTTQTATSPGNTWTQSPIITVSTPPGAVNVTVQAFEQAATAAGETTYYDDVSLAVSGGTPTYAQWSSNSLAGLGLRPQTVRERSLAALATIISGQNPDGTTKGS